MELQQAQLDTLADWLTKMEGRITDEEPVASDINVLRKQVDQHKVGLERLGHSPEFGHYNSICDNVWYFILLSQSFNIVSREYLFYMSVIQHHPLHIFVLYTMRFSGILK